MPSTTIFAETRQTCRRCRAKLVAPTGNPRESFCCRGCFRLFFDKRCLVCEREMERKSGQQKVCGRLGCQRGYNALKAHFALGKYLTSAHSVSSSVDPIKIGVPEGSQTGSTIRWRQVAGLPLSELELHRAVVGGEAALKANRKGNARYIDEANDDTHCLIKRHHPPVNLLGGYRFPGAPEIDWSMPAEQ